jgi:hypothetical protein
LPKKAIELLDAVISLPYSRKGLGYTIGRGLDAILPFTCYYSYWFSCYFDQRGKLMKALCSGLAFFNAEVRITGPKWCEIKTAIIHKMLNI